MNIESVRAELADLLDLQIDDVSDDLLLTGMGNWDSLAMVSLVAFLVSTAGCAVDVKRLASIERVRDLWVLLDLQPEALAHAGSTP